MSAKAYSEQDKIQAVEDLQAGARIGELCRRLGVARSTLHRWQKRFPARRAPDVATPLDDAAEEAEPAGATEDRDASLGRLREENVRLRRIVVRQALAIDALEESLARRENRVPLR